MNAISLKALITKTSLGKTAIYAAIKAGTFPAPLKIGLCRSAWVESEVDQWLASLPRGTHEAPSRATAARRKG